MPLLAELEKLTNEEESPIYEYHLKEPTIEEVQEAVNHLSEMMGHDTSYPYQKIQVEFSEEVEVQVNRRKRQRLKKMKVRFFTSTSGNFCYTFHKRTGYPVEYFNFKKIVKMSIEKETAVEEKRMARVHQLLNRIHPNAWPELKKRPESLRHLGLTELNINSRFPRFVIEELKDAFDNKKNYVYRQPGEKRDLSVEVRVGEDGFVRAWYSSEYAGYANGNYFLLINPTTATFSQYD